MGWDVVQNWMLTGHFEWRVPLRGVMHTWQHKGGKPPMDWWGIQYYSRYTSSSILHLARSTVYPLSPLLVVCTLTALVECSSYFQAELLSHCPAAEQSCKVNGSHSESTQ